MESLRQTNQTSRDRFDHCSVPEVCYRKGRDDVTAELRSAGYRAKRCEGSLSRRQINTETDSYTALKNRKGTRQRTKMRAEEEGTWTMKRTRLERRSGQRRGTRAGEWKLFRECSLHLGFSFVFSSGPRSSPSLWVLAGDYILGSGHSRVRSTTPTLSHSNAFEERNRTNIKKGVIFHRFRKKCSIPPCLRN